MPDEIIQATSPAITRPEVLTEEALRPAVAPKAAASSDDIAAALGRVTPADASTTKVRRGRGRPPGSKNLTPAERASKAGLTVLDPKLNQDEAKRIKDRQEKVARVKARGDELATQIRVELNDYLMQMIVGAGVPAQFIYENGKIPLSVQRNPDLTELGNNLSIPPSLAKSMGKLIAELEGTDGGAKVATAVSSGKLPMVVAGVTTIIGAVQYGKQVSGILEKVKPFIDAAKAAKTKEGSEAQSEGVTNEGGVLVRDGLQ